MDLLHLARKALLAGATAAAALLGTGCKDPPRTPPLQGQVHLTLIHTSDIHSRLFPYNLQLGQIDAGLGLGASGDIVNVGGAARVSHVVGRERARADRVLHLDGGDCFQGAPVFNFYSGEAEVRSLSMMGTDASLVANHEFDRGALNLGIQMQRWANFPVLAANYTFQDPAVPGAPPLADIIKPFTVFDVKGLKVGVIGMGNLSSLTSIFDMPNRLGITPLNTVETAQFYIDMLRPLVDVVVLLTHLGLDVDERMISSTSGADVVLGGHNHIVLQPPKQVTDCSRSEVTPEGKTRHYILVDRPNAGQVDIGCTADADCGDDGVCFGDLLSQQMGTAICKIKRTCQPRPVLLAHSGAFAKFVGRLDLVLSNDTADIAASYDNYDPLDGFEVVSHSYDLFPITEQTPQDPLVSSMLEPYQQGLEALGNLELLVGYALDGSKRNSTGGGDSPLGNLIGTAMWLRLGIQTDFSLTNTTGIRTDLVPGPVTVEQMYNIFPFDNAITKMQLSGFEVQELFDFVARRSAGRGCVSQVQIAGARVVIDCTQVGPQDESQGNPGVATHIYIGAYLDGQGNPIHCKTDKDCPDQLPNQCNSQGGFNSEGMMTQGVCYQPIQPIASYELATSDYLAGGGSGFVVLKRNTTQNNTGVQQRDALIDYIRAGYPCGAGPDGSLTACSQDSDCAGVGPHFVCACPEAELEPSAGSTQCQTASSGCSGKGSCVLSQCRDDVAQFQRQTCLAAATPDIQKQCEANISPCVAGGEQCKFLACVDARLGNYTDGRVLMVGQ